MTRWRREPVLDEYAENDEAVVMLPDGRVLALGPTAWAVLQGLAAGASDTAALRQLLVDQFGVPVDEAGQDMSPQLVTDLLNVLRDQDLVSPAGAEGPAEGLIRSADCGYGVPLT
jgi:hypothetical protein